MTSLARYLFAYGSLLSPASLLPTLPAVDIDDIVPARLAGYRRVFNVAFPNDGSQPDKAYFDEAGGRPPFVLFSNLVPHSEANTNGILVPVSDEQLGALRARERRYGLVTVPARTDTASSSRPVLTFVGAESFTAPRDVRAGVVAASYLNLLVDGAQFWEQRHPGFLDEFHASTRMPADAVALRRVDLAGQHRGTALGSGTSGKQAPK
ncbi:MAG: gamma-glutamylcyclotransferase family protein [Candidatus Nanopelagicales bacterium]